MPEFDVERAYLSYYRNEMTDGRNPISKLDFLIVCQELCKELLKRGADEST